MIQEIFVDGVLGAGFSGGALRLDFFSHSPEKGGEKTPRVRLILTPEGFAGCCKSMETLLAKLVEAGLVRADAGHPIQTQPGQTQPGQAQPKGAPSSPGRAQSAHQAGDRSPTGSDAPKKTQKEQETATPAGDKGLSPNF